MQPYAPAAPEQRVARRLLPFLGLRRLHALCLELLQLVAHKQVEGCGAVRSGDERGYEICPHTHMHGSATAGSAPHRQLTAGQALRLLALPFCFFASQDQGSNQQ